MTAKPYANAVQNLSEGYAGFAPIPEISKALH